MPYTLSVVGQGEVTAPDHESILDTLLRKGIRVSYGCRRGKCATCKHYILEGRIDDSEVSAYALLDEERDEGMTLLCKSYPLTDCVIELADDDDDIEATDPSPVPRSANATVSAIEQVSRSLWTVTMRLDEQLEFIPGQYLEVSVPGQPDVTRSYSLASPVQWLPEVQLVIKRIEDGAFSRQLGPDLLGKRLVVTGPFGSMRYRPSPRPTLLVGAGSGIAPLMSILRTASASDEVAANSIRLFYCARERADIPFVEEFEALSTQIPTLEVHITLTRPSSADSWEGHTGRVVPLLAHECGDDPNFDAYLCGPPGLCDDVQLLLEARGTPPKQIRADAFYPAS
jgi:NAD(P)H-flavin reductase/ferredoxin